MPTRLKPLEERTGAIARRALLCAGAGGLLLLMAACSGTTSLLSNMPAALGGLPADAPARPVNSDLTSYPAVHDMPPPREAATLTPEQVKAVEAEIAFARERQKQQARGASQPQTEER